MCDCDLSWAVRSTLRLLDDMAADDAQRNLENKRLTFAREILRALLSYSGEAWPRSGYTKHYTITPKHT